jgi:glycosyltransferase involved in cell wall biosynthesis
MALPKVTVVTPSFNQGKFLAETIESVRGQTYPNIEYIVVDGGSSDETTDVLQRYKHRIDVTISEPDRGQADAINKGLRRATGEFVTWINSDDVLDKNAVQAVVGALTSRPEVDLVYGDAFVLDEASKVIGLQKGRPISMPHALLDLDLPIPQQGAIWRAHLHESVGLLSERWHVVLDREFFLRICVQHKSLYLPQVLGGFRQHASAKSSKMQRGWITELPAMYEAMTHLEDWPHDTTPRFNSIMISSARVHAAYIAFAVGEIGQGLRAMGNATREYPCVWFMPHIYEKPLNKLVRFAKRALRANP